MAGLVGRHVTDFILKTPRLRLHPVKEQDANQLHELFVSPDIRRFLWDDRVISREQTLDIITKSGQLFSREGYGLWLVRPSDRTQEAIGFTGLWHFRDPPELELLFGISKKWWDRGVATEAARVVMVYAFARLGFTRINASTDAPNSASIRVLEKLGMRCTRRETIGGLDTVFFSVEASEFAE